MLCLLLFVIPTIKGSILTKYPIKPTDDGMSTPEMILNHGYPVEIHHFKTEDGFILEYHRIPYGRKNKNQKMKRFPVIVMHGMALSSAQDVAQGPKKGLSYMLADNGFDVWAANMRGNHYSRNHTKLHWKRNMKEYYDFTFHEIGYYDIPAAIDYILNITNFKKLVFYGNSLGGQVFLAFGATRPEYVDKIQLAVLVSPTGYMKNNYILGALASYYIDSLWDFIKKYNLYSMDFTHLRKVATEIQSWPLAMEIAVALGTEILTDREDALALKPYLGAYLANTPSEQPFKTIIHSGQLMKSGMFRQFDYGKQKNLKKYGTPTPPNYNISAITCPVATYYSRRDFLVPYEEQIHLKNELPNLVHDYVETSYQYNHLSFGGARNCAEKVWSDIIRLIKKYTE